MKHLLGLIVRIVPVKAVPAYLYLSSAYEEIRFNLKKQKKAKRVKRVSKQ